MLERLRTFFSSNSTIARFRSFFSGNEYPPLIAFAILVAYVTKMEIAVVVLLALLTAFAVLISRDLKCVLPILLIVPYCIPLAHSPGIPTYSDYYKTPWVLAIGISIACVVVAAIVMHYILWGGIRETFLKKSELTIYILMLGAGLLLNGVGAEGYTKHNDFVTGLPLVAIWLLLYVILLRGLKYDKGLVEYVCNIFQWVAVLLLLELVFIVMTNNVISDGTIIKDQIVFGWGINNNYGGILVWLIPPIFYLAITRKSGWIQLILSLLCVFAIFFSMCRSALVVGAGLYLVCLGVACFVGRNKMLFRLFTVGCVVAAGLLFLFFREELLSTFRYYLDRGFSDSGRIDMWYESWLNFLKYPVFGAGFHATPFEPWSGRKYGYCHNTIIQLFSAGGALAGVTYLLMRAKTIWMALYRTNKERIFFAFSLAALLGVSLLDNHMFNIYPGFYYALLVALIEQDYVKNTTLEERNLLGRLREKLKKGKTSVDAGKEETE